MKCRRGKIRFWSPAGKSYRRPSGHGSSLPLERLGSEAEIGSDDFLAGEIAHGFIAGRAKADFGEGHLRTSEHKISKQTEPI
ncbi:hypothetical protein K9M78_08185 [Candidatus Bipolaricaulota bacterium]|nr:hypothetical protein [Candidatus Bipolaricaulota bacterium]